MLDRKKKLANREVEIAIAPDEYMDLKDPAGKCEIPIHDHGDRSGIIMGVRMLRAYELFFDYRYNRVGFKRNKHTSEP